MTKIFLIIILVIAGVIGGIMFLSKNEQKNTDNSLFTTSPSPVVSPEPSTNVSPSPEESVTPTASVTAIIKTSKGDITLSLFGQDAPKTVANFVNKARSGFYNNLTFHRVEDWVIQGGDPKGDGTGGGQMPTELNDKPFVVGSLGVARGQDITISNDAQFFITKTDASWLNKQYTNFGIVTAGMDVVNKIAIGDKILSISIQ
ncbi:MAG: peptidylprolyl isomerase [Candidatus Levyibacteriota bacterium]